LTCVLDASVVINWLLPDEYDPRADRLLGEMPGRPTITTALWPLQVINALRWAVARDRVSIDDARLMIDSLNDLPVSFDEPTLTTATAVFDLAHEHRLSACDAAYLDLARRLNLPLATLDDRLATAAAEVDVTLLFEGPA